MTAHRPEPAQHSRARRTGGMLTVECPRIFYAVVYLQPADNSSGPVQSRPYRVDETIMG
jgi:hypothetical protein